MKRIFLLTQKTDDKTIQFIISAINEDHLNDVITSNYKFSNLIDINKELYIEEIDTNNTCIRLIDGNIKSDENFTYHPRSLFHFKYFPLANIKNLRISK